MNRYHNTAGIRGQTSPARPGSRVRSRARLAGRSRAAARSGDPFWDLVATARRLQAPGGCPWDRAQTLESLFPHLLEETWEVFVEIRSRRHAQLQEELGDALYTVLFLTLIAERNGWCDLRSLLADTRRKMVRRHPHVFGAVRARTPRDAYQAWQMVKRGELKASSRSKTLRPLLMACFDLLHTQPQTERRLKAMLTRTRRIRSAQKRPSARPQRSTTR